MPEMAKIMPEMAKKCLKMTKKCMKRLICRNIVNKLSLLGNRVFSYEETTVVVVVGAFLRTD